MKKTIEILPRQTLLDLALQTHGTAEAAWDLADALGCDVSDDPTPGILILITTTDPPADKAAADVVLTYEAEGVRPATALTADERLILQDGIGYWRIDEDFIVC